MILHKISSVNMIKISPFLVLMVWQIRLECLSLAVFRVSLVFRVRPLSNVIKNFTAVSYEFS
jgi:hypothetical protein